MRVFLGKVLERLHKKRHNKHFLKHLRGEYTIEEVQKKLNYGFDIKYYPYIEKCIQEGVKRRIQNHMFLINFFLFKERGNEQLSSWFFYTEMYLILFEFKVGIRKFNQST